MDSVDDLSINLKINSVVSIHDQLVAHFSEKITTGYLSPGDPLPSENALAKQLSISRMTVRRVFDTLVYAGLLARRQGKGTFVATETSGLIGFIGQTLVSGISSELVAHLNVAIEERNLSGWHLLVCGAQNDPERQLRYIQTLQAHGVRGIILAPAVLEAYERNTETLRSLRRANLPFVLIERYVEQVDSDYVVSDNFKAGCIATQHLINLGHKRIAFMTGWKVPSIIQRYEGYRTTLEDNGLSFDPSLVVYWPDHTVELEGVQLADIVQKGATALVTYTDQGAIHCINRCMEKGINVPGDLAVVGIGDLRISWGAKPILTTVRHDFKAMADLALDILLKRISGSVDTNSWFHVSSDVELVVRESCGAKHPKAATV